MTDCLKMIWEMTGMKIRSGEKCKQQGKRSLRHGHQGPPVLIRKTDIRIDIENNGIHACKDKTQMFERSLQGRGSTLVSVQFEWGEYLKKTLCKDSR